MKKDKKIVKHINHIKGLMGLPLLNESTDDECISQLTDDDGIKYIVTAEDECVGKMDCVIQTLKKSGIADDSYKTSKWSDGRCFIVLKNQKKTFNLVFWEDGDISFIGVFSANQNIKDKKEKDQKVKKFMYEGTYDCTNGTTTYTDFLYHSLVKEDGKTKIDKIDFKPLGSNNSTLPWTVSGFFKHHGVSDTGNLTDLLTKLGFK